MTKYVEIDAYIHFDSSRQTIKNSNTTLELLEIKKMKHSYKNLKEVPAVQNYDVCTNLVIWDERRLRNYKSNNGYRLHQANHIIDVKVG